MARKFPPFAPQVRVQPDDYRGIYSTSARSGLITGVVADSDLFCLQNGQNDTTLYLRKMSVGFVTTTAFGTPQVVDFAGYIGRSWTVYGGGGNAISNSSDFNQRNSSMPVTVTINNNIANTGALTSSTRTLDANPFAQIAGWSGGVGTTIPLVANNFLDIDALEHPIVLKFQEGIVIRNRTAFGASGVGYLYVTFEWIEADSGTWD